MNYAAARPQIRAGDLLAWTHREVHSWHDFKVMAVRTGEMSEYSHVGLAWPIGGRVFVLEAVMPQVRIFPLSKLGEFFWLPMAIEDHVWDEKGLPAALEHVGDEYSQFQAILAWFGKKCPDRKFYCDEFCRMVYDAMGIALADDLMPSGLVRAAQLRGAQTMLVQP